MAESEERLEVDDLVDAWDLDDAELLADDVRESRSARWTAAARGWSGRHRHALLAAGAVVVVAATAVGAWKVAHPYRFPVPLVAVTVPSQTSSSTLVVVPGDGEIVPLPIELDITPQQLDGARLTFEGLTGLDVTSSVSAPVPVTGATHLTAVPTIDCSSWTGAGELLASFEVTDGVSTRTLTVPVQATSGAPGAVDTVAAAACVGYNAANPLKATEVVVEPHPVQPLLHVIWTVHNAGKGTWQVGGQGTGGSGPFAILPGDIAVTDVPAGATREILSTLRVQNCAPATSSSSEPLQMSLSAMRNAGVDAVDETMIVAPADDLDAVLAAAATVCKGAPAVTIPPATITSLGSGSLRAGRITVHLDLAAPGAWTAALDQPLWWDPQQTRAFQPLTSATVQGPGSVDLSVTYRPSGCFASGQDISLATTLQSGGRIYPYVVPATLPDAWTCPSSTS